MMGCHFFAEIGEAAPLDAAWIPFPLRGNLKRFLEAEHWAG
jgi:hypothetical protein